MIFSYVQYEIITHKVSFDKFFYLKNILRKKENVNL